ncbi:MAG: phenylalanine--tRNA ligase subunit beta [Phycisphaerales bacterium JB059]
MDISLHWLNKYLAPDGLTPDEADDLLTRAGFPIEARTDLGGGDVLLDVEVTSNRGDCLSHLGCAREIAASRSASTPRQLMPPVIHDPSTEGHVADHLALTNHESLVCPRFTARVIRNVTVGPSPDWLVTALESIGQRSINNVVDVTNFITHELGNPCHVFDLARLAGAQLHVRFAREGETLTTLDAKSHTLRPTDLVVADAQRPQSLAGVMGGKDSEVTPSTTDVVFEMATWDPVTIRSAARRLAIRTDAGYRFERGVDPRTIDDAARRAVALICELTGGTLCDGVLDQGAPLPAPTRISLRPSRCDRILGIRVPAGDIIESLRALEIGVEQVSEDELRCTIPPHRLDLTREIDLVEEVARTTSLDVIPIQDRLAINVRPPQESERAMREVGALLTGMGFYETVTFSFTSPQRAKMFRPEDLTLLAVDDDRRKAEPTLRPSVLTGLLECRRANQDAGVTPPGGVRLYEVASVFAERDGASVEHRNLALLLDASDASAKPSHDDAQRAVRTARGAVETLARALAGPDARVRVEPSKPHAPAFDDRAYARLTLEAGASSAPLGYLALLGRKARDAFGHDVELVVAELGIDPLLAHFPPAASVHPLPEFPAIERDLSLVLAEDVPWARVDKLVREASLDRLESCDFVGVYRGKQVGAGKKSLTLRLTFRDPGRTLRHEEVDPQVETALGRFKQALNAEIRA